MSFKLVIHTIHLTCDVYGGSTPIYGRCRTTIKNSQVTCKVSESIIYIFSRICNNVFCTKCGTMTSMGTLLTGYLLYLVNLVAYFIQCFILIIGTLRKMYCVSMVSCYLSIVSILQMGFEKKTKLALTRDTYRALSITGQNES